MGHPQRLFSKDEPQQHMTCSIPHLMPIGITETCSIFSPPDSPSYKFPRSTVSLPVTAFADNPCTFSLINVVAQLPPEYEPLNFLLAHSICLLTAYSESLRVFALLFTLPRRRITRTAISLFWSLVMVWLRVPEIH